jgi:hypothetical protein
MQIQELNSYEILYFVWQACCIVYVRTADVDMFKISVVESDGEQRLILEGTLVHPWTAEVEKAWRRVASGESDHKPIIDLQNVTAINRDGEETLYKLMGQGARFLCVDVFTKDVLKRVAKKIRCNA